MKIAYVQRTSLIDYPGQIAALVFTPGCNLRCPYCHNPGLVSGHPGMETLWLKDVYHFLERRKGKLDGIVVTGGEPTLQTGLDDFMERVRGMGFCVKLDTNGTRPDVLERIVARGLVDYIAMDIKAPLEKYSSAAGTLVDVTSLVESMRIIRGSGVPYEFRTTFVPGLLSGDDVLAIAGMIRGASLYVLQGFVPSKHLDPSYETASPPPMQEMLALADACRQYVARCIVR